MLNQEQRERLNRTRPGTYERYCAILHNKIQSYHLPATVVNADPLGWPDYLTAMLFNPTKSNNDRYVLWHFLWRNWATPQQASALVKFWYFTPWAKYRQHEAGFKKVTRQLTTLERSAVSGNPEVLWDKFRYPYFDLNLRRVVPLRRTIQDHMIFEHGSWADKSRWLYLN